MEYSQCLVVDSYDYDGCNCSGSPLKKSKVSYSSKTFCDPVHGQIALHPACVAVIDTPQFQRLRSIKQTGLVDHVFPGATHDRFSHCLGVCYLAGKFIQELQLHQPELPITTADILCVQLAGLCHDLGHGPFSHTWESFMKEVNAKKNVKTWKHEIVSVNMFDYLIEENNLAQFLKKFGIGTIELNLIKDLILGNQPKSGNKAFLYQIVNNDESGLDVDKWDYFLRDCHYLGLPCSFEYERLIQFAKVFMVDGRSKICFRDKILESVYNVFRTRSNLHRLAYQHKVVMIMERMFIDAVILGDGKCIGPSGEVLQFWEWSMAAAYSHGETLQKALSQYSKLVDGVVFSCLKYSSDPKLLPASNLIAAMEKRSQKNGFYQHVGLKILPYMVTEDDISKGLAQLLSAGNERVMCSLRGTNVSEKDLTPVTAEDICVCVVPVNWGKGDKNPVDFVHFFSKNCVFSKNSESCYDVSAMLPKSFQEIQVHVLSRRSDDYGVKVAKWCFENFWDCSSVKSNSHL